MATQWVFAHSRWSILISLSRSVMETITIAAYVSLKCMQVIIGDRDDINWNCVLQHKMITQVLLQKLTKLSAAKNDIL